ncbi:hypothetical protein OIV83_003388 [Microbotryomycetes sp. JL201]|nr:hypothetical protein OIV83_003388 [Microbotryomycetes sp. JL201]
MPEDYFASHRLAADGAPPPPIRTQSDSDLTQTSDANDDEDEVQQPKGEPARPASDDKDKELPELPAIERDATHESRKLKPDEIVAVLGNEPGKVPEPDRRFLHGGPPLAQLDAPSTLPLGALTGLSKESGGQNDTAAKPIANARWRAFTDEEEKMLQVGWQRRQQQTRTQASGLPESDLLQEAETHNVDLEQPHCYPVGLDRLFTVDLSKGILTPAFWSGTPVRVIRAHWFYPPSSTTTAEKQSHNIKPYPVDPQLAAALDRAYATIRPWEDSYSMELQSALKGGITAQLKLASPLDLRNESGAHGGADSGIEVIFANADEGRVYSKSIIGSVGKSFFSSGSELGGGQVVIRGWDAMRTYHERRTLKKKVRDGKTIDTMSESSRDHSPARPRRGSEASTALPEKKPADAGIFGYLKSKIYGPPGQDSKGDQEKVDERQNETSEAMAGPRNREGEGGVGEVGEADELVLVVHGIGQKLAGHYESFNFVHAVNQLRNACTALSTSSTLAPLLHSKRAQFIPLLWRTDLEFDNEVDEKDSEDEHLRNSFTLSDIEIKGAIPFLRQIVSGLVLDVPLYQSHHKQKMTRAVVKEANRIYRLFCARNPSFAANGRVSLIAHSLGSALAADILSSQPTFVKPLKDMTRDERFSETQFVFDTRTCILVGSPLAFFMHLGRGQLIARAGRERSKRLGRDIALDRAGRYGCMAVDSVYNVFYETDPVAFALNPTVDVEYARLIKPIPIPSTNHTLLENLSETYQRVSKMFTWTSKGDAGAKKADEETDTTESVENKDDPIKFPVAPKLVKRPTNKRMPSERPMDASRFEAIHRAEQRFKALNPNGCIDFFLPAEGLNQYVEALSSHGAYWNDPRFSNFVLLQLFASSEELERTGREEIGEADEEDEE